MQAVGEPHADRPSLLPILRSRLTPVDHAEARGLSRICIVPFWWTRDTFRGHTCFDRSHSHISGREADDLRHNRRAVWLISPDPERHVRGVLRMMDTHAVRGFAARYGPWLAKHKHEEIGRLMLAFITQRPMEDE